MREQDGLIWVYVAAKNEAPEIGAAARSDCRMPAPRWTETQTFPCDIDHAVIGLMDPAHGPYVHAHWWWKKTPQGEGEALRAPAHRLRDDGAQAVQAGL